MKKKILNLSIIGMLLTIGILSATVTTGKVVNKAGNILELSSGQVDQLYDMIDNIEDPVEQQLVKDVIQGVIIRNPDNGASIDLDKLDLSNQEAEDAALSLGNLRTNVRFYSYYMKAVGVLKLRREARPVDRALVMTFTIVTAGQALLPIIKIGLTDDGYTIWFEVLKLWPHTYFVAKNDFKLKIGGFGFQTDDTTINVMLKEKEPESVPKSIIVDKLSSNFLQNHPLLFPLFQRFLKL